MTKQELIKMYPHICMEIASEYLDYSIVEVENEYPPRLQGVQGDKYWEDFLNHIDPLPEAKIPSTVKDKEFTTKTTLEYTHVPMSEAKVEDRPGIDGTEFKLQLNGTFNHGTITKRSQPEVKPIGPKYHRLEQPEGFVIMTFKSRNSTDRFKYVHLPYPQGAASVYRSGTRSLYLRSLTSDPNFYISTVKRISDGQWFSVGKTYKISKTVPWSLRIDEIRIIEGEVVAFFTAINRQYDWPITNRVLVKNLQYENNINSGIW